MTKYTRGLELNWRFFCQVVRPLLKQFKPGLKYSAGRIGWGSDVLGYDTPVSRDHCWGPFLQIFLPEAGFEKTKSKLHEFLRFNLPRSFMGFPVGFEDLGQPGIRKMQLSRQGPVEHNFEILTVRGYFQCYLGIDPRPPIPALKWFCMPEQRLLGMTSGALFHDDLKVEVIRKKLNYYPHDVWLALLAAEWARISDEVAFIGRCAQLQEELGSQLITGRLVRSIMKLCFLMEKQYPPYSKWFGTAFKALKCSKNFQPLLTRLFRTTDLWKRNDLLNQAYEKLGRMHDKLKITKPLKLKAKDNYQRDYKFVAVSAVPEAICKKIRSKEVKQLEYRTGAIDQFVDSCRILEDPVLQERLENLFISRKNKTDQ